MADVDTEPGIDLSVPQPIIEPPTVSHPTGRPNFCCMASGKVVLWFSYHTCIAFRSDWLCCVRENEWGPTTGKHLKYVESRYGLDKKARMSSDDFEMAYEKVFSSAYI